MRAVINNIEGADAWPELDLFGVYHPHYQAWLSNHFAPIERQEPGLQEVLWGPGGDPDCDDLPNAMECYLGLDPRSRNKQPFSCRIVGNNLRIRWYRAADVQGITIGYQTSVNLSAWTVGRGSLADVQGVFNPIGFRLQELLIPITGEERYVRFFCETR